MNLRSASTRFLLVAACLFPGISAAHSAPDKTSRDAHGAIVFGFDLRGSPQEDARQYLPFLAYLEQHTGYRFKLRFTPANSNIVDDLASGAVDLAAVGAVSYLHAARHGARPIVRGLNKDGKPDYRSCLVTRLDSPIRSVADLRGRRLAFGGQTSTQGHLIPRIVLAQHNINLSDLAGHEFTGSHQNCADAVISGRFDACGMQDTQAEKLAAEGLLRIVHRSDWYPSSGIVAGPRVTEPMLARLRQALLDFQPQGRDAARLYNWGGTEMPKGFAPSTPQDYAALEAWLVRLKLLDNAGAGRKSK